jgi:hypothetical protein
MLVKQGPDEVRECDADNNQSTIYACASMGVDFDYPTATCLLDSIFRDTFSSSLIADAAAVTVVVGGGD